MSKWDVLLFRNLHELHKSIEAFQVTREFLGQINMDHRMGKVRTSNHRASRQERVMMVNIQVCLTQMLQKKKLFI